MTVTTPPSRQLVSNAAIAMLRQTKGAGGLGRPVGDNQAPALSSAQPDERIDYPYYIWYDLDGGGRSGDYADDLGDAQFAFQLSCVGKTRQQAQWAADLAERVLVGRTDGVYTSTMTDPAGLSVIRRTLDLPAGVLRQGDSKQAVFVVPLRGRLDVCQV